MNTPATIPPMSLKGNRIGMTDFICKEIEFIAPGGENAAITRKNLESLTNAQFAELMDDFYAETEIPCVYVPHGGKVKLDTKRNIKVAKERYNHDFWQHLEIGSNDPDTPVYITPAKYMVTEMSWRRQSQVAIIGISVPEHQNTVDQRTGAVTGDSAAAKISGPEGNLYHAMGMTNTLHELLNVRGGDEGSYRAMEAEISRTGGASLATIERYSSGVGVVDAMRSMLLAMHLSNTL